MRNLPELIDADDPAWPLVQSWIANATNPVEVLPATAPKRSEALLATQVTTRSPMGAVIFETGGLLVDSGWVRILGSAHARLPRSLPQWNHGRTFDEPQERPACLLVADDVVGGFFAVNGGRLGNDLGAVHYFAPDTLEWEQITSGYTAFLQWCLSGDIAKFYQSYRWPNWQTEVRSVPGDRGLLIYPFPSTQGPPIPERLRRVVPISELFDLFVGRLK
jgi:hypothetical protein